VTTNVPFLRPHSESEYDYMDNDELPDWPSEIAFDDTKRFHLVRLLFIKYILCCLFNELSYGFINHLKCMNQ